MSDEFEQISDAFRVIERGSAAERASEYLRAQLNRQWQQAISGVVSAANKRDPQAALAAAMELAAIKKFADVVRVDIAAMNRAEDYLRVVKEPG